VHSTAQVLGYAPAARAITRFAIAASTHAAGAAAWVRVQFKLETLLVRWRVNQLQLTAPSGFNFTCSEELAQNAYVLPVSVVYPATLPRFQDLVRFLELPPARGIDGYRNEGTTEDGRAIVDCSQVGRLALAVDSTDTSSLGRYAFRVSVKNPMELPVPNVWTLRSYSEGQLIEEGATGGYVIGSTMEFHKPQNAAVPPSTAWRSIKAVLQYTLLNLILSGLA